ncbi:MAG: hypothetical protein ACRC20_09885 [Segniliparus sp.]|uniref:hypothetical protein n=1 Tax=Segniliparus sp. TaxID=2804064 RepID=UPI003F347272
MRVTPGQPEGTSPESGPADGGVPQWFYPALGLPQTPEAQAPPHAGGPLAQPWQDPQPWQPAQPEPKEAGRPRKWEKALAGCLAVACVFLLGWWWGARRTEGGDSSPLAAIVGSTAQRDSLASLSDDELFALLPTEADYPDDWKVTRTRGAKSTGADLSTTRISPPECDLSKSTKAADAVGSVKGESPQLPLIESSSAEVRLVRDARGSGEFTEAEDFAKRCSTVTVSAEGVTAVMRLRARRGTVPQAEESMTITMRGKIQSSSAISVPVVLTITGARSRGLVVIGSGMRAGFALPLPKANGEDPDDEDVLGQLLSGTIQRIKQK